MNKITISTGHPDAGRVYAEAYGEALAREDALQALSITRIMLDVVPGEDGMGEEIYAKSVADVEALLSKQCEDIEALQDREAALREELRNMTSLAMGRGGRVDSLRDRLAVAEQLLRETSDYLDGSTRNAVWGDSILHKKMKAALKPAAEGDLK